MFEQFASTTLRESAQFDITSRGGQWPWTCNAGVKWNFWLHTMCACTEHYSVYQICWENWWL